MLQGEARVQKYKEENNMMNQMNPAAVCETRRRINTEALKGAIRKALTRVLTYVPAAVIIVLVALYYISLSKLGPA